MNPSSYSTETQFLEKKSLKVVIGKSADFGELAKDCVCLANAKGGIIAIGIEDNSAEPPADQKISVELHEKIQKRIGELTVNVAIAPQLHTAQNGGEYIRLIVSRSNSIASTSDGHYYIRIADTCKPLLGDDVSRLLNERAATPWETLTNLEVPRDRIDTAKTQKFCQDIRNSDRVKSSVKEKTDAELLDHYSLTQGEWLTNLGILCIGQRSDRARLGTAPVIQFLKYDEQERKVNKLVWDDFSLSPLELVPTVWQEIPDFRERYELPDGLFRQTLPLYDETVVRELLVNALVHRPYTQRGDIFINLFRDRLEIVNAGTLPLGVTPQNILHTTVRRNDQLARVFHDLKFMEREGSGFDKIYEVLLSQGRSLPEISEGEALDRVQVTIYRKILKQDVIDFIAQIDAQYQLTQRERITLCLLAQHESLNARELGKLLTLPEDNHAISPWLGKLLSNYELVKQSGKGQATRYYIDPELLRSTQLRIKTTLQRIEPHRLEALILEDLRHYPKSSISAIQDRIAPELLRSRIKRALEKMVQDKTIDFEGENRGRRYSLTANSN
jgi:ATP-dependent DNA helicase RecG